MHDYTLLRLEDVCSDGGSSGLKPQIVDTKIVL